jgi:hypothetical protein
MDKATEKATKELEEFLQQRLIERMNEWFSNYNGFIDPCISNYAPIISQQ